MNVWQRNPVLRPQPAANSRRKPTREDGPTLGFTGASWMPGVACNYPLHGTGAGRPSSCSAPPRTGSPSWPCPPRGSGASWTRSSQRLLAGRRWSGVWPAHRCWWNWTRPDDCCSRRDGWRQPASSGKSAWSAASTGSRSGTMRASLRARWTDPRPGAVCSVSTVRSRAGLPAGANTRAESPRVERLYLPRLGAHRARSHRGRTA